MSTTTHRTLFDRTAGIARMIKALGRDPDEWDPADVTLLAALHSAVDTTMSTVIYGLRDNGFTDTEIAAALGVTQQAVSKRWPGGRRYVGAAGRYRKSNGRDANG